MSVAPGAPISLPVANSAKPPSKGVDVDAVGNVKGVQIYEYDLNSIKIDEKPWRKPGWSAVVHVFMIKACTATNAPERWHYINDGCGAI